MPLTFCLFKVSMFLQLKLTVSIKLSKTFFKYSTIFLCGRGNFYEGSNSQISLYAC